MTIEIDGISTIPSPAFEDSDVSHEIILPELKSASSLFPNWGSFGNEFYQMWSVQAGQQRELGLDPQDLGEIERRHAFGDLINHMYEEVGELSRTVPVHKRHVLRMPKAGKTAIAEEVADILKCAIAAAQLYGVSPDDVHSAFIEKTQAVSQQAKQERLALEKDTLVLCFDLDDCICDLSPWRNELGFADYRELNSADVLNAQEVMKASFYEGGRFRDMEPIQDAPAALRMAKKLGYTIALITARPQWQYKCLRSDTVYWLGKHDIPYDLLIFSRNKVEAIHENIYPAWPILFVEDLEKNARELNAAGVPVILFSQPHNQGVSIPGVERVSAWSEITRKF